MLRYEYFIDDEKDTCEIYEEQQQYLIALGLTNACSQIGR